MLALDVVVSEFSITAASSDDLCVFVSGLVVIVVGGFRVGNTVESEKAGRSKRKPQSTTGVYSLLPENLSISGPAGSGKTFVALHTTLRVLLDGGSVSFIARNSALGAFAATWLGRQARRAGLNAGQVLNNLQILCAPFDKPPFRATVQGNQVVLERTSLTVPSSTPATLSVNENQPAPGVISSPTEYLLVVDEAHHVYTGL